MARTGAKVSSGVVEKADARSAEETVNVVVVVWFRGGWPGILLVLGPQWADMMWL